MIGNKFAADADIYRSICNGKTSLLNLSSNKFALLKTPTKDELREILTEFRCLQEDLLNGFFLSERKEFIRENPGAFRRASRGAKLDSRETIIGLTGTPDKTNMHFTFFTAKSLKETALKQGLGEQYGFSGRKGDRINFKLLEMDLNDQREIVKEILWKRNPENYTNKEIIYWIGPEIELKLEESNSAENFLEYVSKELEEFLSPNRSFKAIKKNRPIALYWLANYLKMRGVWLFPQYVYYCCRLGAGIPHHFSKSFDSVFSTPQSHIFMYGFREWVSHASNAMPSSQTSYLTLLRYVDHVSTLIDQPVLDSSIIKEIKAFFKNDESMSLNSLHKSGIRYIWKYLHEYLDTPLSDVCHDDLLLAGKARDNTRVAWAWVDNTDINCKNYFELTGFKEPEEHSDIIKEWARRLRPLLSDFGIKTVDGVINGLRFWLVYLETLNRPPKNFSEVQRHRHINSGSVNENCFMNFMRGVKLEISRKNIVFAYLEKAWILDATLHNRPLSECQINRKVDKFIARSSRKGRTSRRAIDQEILEIIISENRRSDFKFSKNRIGSRAKKQALDERLVRSPKTGKVERRWFPGTAILLDLLLNVPLRKFQARFLDSGEGDFEILDINTLEYKSNELATASQGRKQGFFIRKQRSLVEGDFILGMFINTNKTGRPYEVSWISEEVAKNVNRVIEWQKIYNPISAPVICTDAVSRLKYQNEALQTDSYPIFRDPEDPLHSPISDTKIQKYFIDLLKHCEPIISAKLNQNIRLFYPNGTPIFDVHSLRVTGVTTLLENGVDPEIVKELVGHASIEMTWYYNAIFDAKINRSLQEALAARTLNTSELLANPAEEIEKLSPFLFNTREETDDDGLEAFQEKIDMGDARWEVFSHGICSGGTCSEGGEYYKNAYKSLHRTRACPLCRFRLTGTGFLAGLIQNANKIMWEIKEAQRNIADMQINADDAEDAGNDPRPYRSQIHHLRVHSDNLFEEWFAEITYVKRAEALLSKWMEGDVDKSLPSTFADNCVEHIEARTQIVHDLPFLHRLVKNSDILPGAQLPRGPEEDRNAMLLQIARTNNIDELFYRLDEKMKKAAFDIFGDAIVSAIKTEDEMELALNGQPIFQVIDGLEDKINKAIKEIPKSEPHPSSQLSLGV